MPNPWDGRILIWEPAKKNFSTEKWQYGWVEYSHEWRSFEVYTKENSKSAIFIKCDLVKSYGPMENDGNLFKIQYLNKKKGVKGELIDEVFELKFEGTVEECREFEKKVRETCHVGLDPIQDLRARVWEPPRYGTPSSPSSAGSDHEPGPERDVIYLEPHERPSTSKTKPKIVPEIKLESDTEPTYSSDSSRSSSRNSHHRSKRKTKSRSKSKESNQRSEEEKRLRRILKLKKKIKKEETKDKEKTKKHRKHKKDKKEKKVAKDDKPKPTSTSLKYCDTCDFSLPKDDWEKHQESLEHKRSKYKQKRSMNFVSSKYVENGDKDGQKFKCTFCDMKFVSGETLAIHLDGFCKFQKSPANKHLSQDQPSTSSSSKVIKTLVRCELCRRDFESNEKFEKHKNNSKSHFELMKAAVDEFQKQNPRFKFKTPEEIEEEKRRKAIYKKMRQNTKEKKKNKHVSIPFNYYEEGRFNSHWDRY